MKFKITEVHKFNGNIQVHVRILIEREFSTTESGEEEFYKKIYSEDFIIYEDLILKPKIRIKSIEKLFSLEALNFLQKNIGQILKEGWATRT